MQPPPPRGGREKELFNHNSKGGREKSYVTTTSREAGKKSTTPREAGKKSYVTITPREAGKKSYATTSPGETMNIGAVETLPLMDIRYIYACSPQGGMSRSDKGGSVK